MYVLKPYQTECSSPVIFSLEEVTPCFFVDYMKLNAVTIRHLYPIPRRDDCIVSLGDATILSMLDTHIGYWLAQVAEKDWAKTSFTLHYGLFHYTHMLYGSGNGPRGYQISRGVLRTTPILQLALIYFGDTVTFSRRPYKQIDCVWQVLILINDACVKLSFEEILLLHKLNYLFEAGCSPKAHWTLHSYNLGNTMTRTSEQLEGTLTFLAWVGISPIRVISCRCGRYVKQVASKRPTGNYWLNRKWRDNRPRDTESEARWPPFLDLPRFQGDYT